MPNTKKYVSFDKLGLYDEKIKQYLADADSANLDEAKAYADDLADNYDAAGSASSVDAKLTAEVNRATVREDEIAAANTATQGEVDKLETYVGTIPTGATAKNVVAYVEEKTADIASGTAFAELGERVTQAETDIDNIEKDYLKAADKAELSDAISAEVSRADAAEKVNAAAIKAISDDYLKSADKTELQGGIDTNAEAIAAVKEDVDAFFASADMSESAKDTLKELQEYIASDETGAAAMTASIQQNAKDIDAVETRMTTAEGKITTAEGNISDNASAIANLQAAIADGGSVDVRIDALESAIGESGSVADDIATAKDEAIAAAAADAKTKADTALANAKKYADDEDAKIETRVDALESTTHTHANKAELDKIVTGDKAKWDAAQANAEATAANALAGAVSTLEGKITAAQTAAEKKATDYNTAMDTRVSSLEDWHNNFTEVSEEDINQLFQ